MHYGEVVDIRVKTVRKWSTLANDFSADFHPKQLLTHITHISMKRYGESKTREGVVFHRQDWCQKIVFLNAMIFAFLKFVKNTPFTCFVFSPSFHAYLCPNFQISQLF